MLNQARTFDEAMSDYQSLRDTAVGPIYGFTTELATLEPPPAELQQLLGALPGNQTAMDAFVSITAGTLSPAAFFDPANIRKMLAAAPAR